MERQTAPHRTTAWEDSMPLIIESSHQRSQKFGLRPDSSVDFGPVPKTDLSLLLEQNRMLHTHAVPAMETLYQQIVNTHNMVLLTDANGVIVHSLGDDDFLEKASRVALKPGAAWSEQSKGTNAIGTAIAEQAAVLVHADQHYLTANHFLTCSAAPIADHLGNVIGVLDVSGDQRSFHKHTMALVRMSALMIENQLFSATFEDVITLHFHARPEFIGTLMEGIASFSPGGRFLAANRNGLFQLGLSYRELQSHTFSSLFGLPVSALYEHYRAASPGLLNLCMHSGVRVAGRAQLRISNSVFQQSLTHDRPSAVAANQAAAAKRRLSGLRYLRTGDPQLELMIDKVTRVLGHDIPIMIMGETGTGKELLAQAIHNDSPRAMNPFVAVNCASIPETLIESELFGYEDGAFTGARKKGAVGKILQANGGTLFLDEIGDMPFSLQARLLRVLQERMVTPLGSDKSIPVNVELICATNHNLRNRIAQGLFREDLYYRLNGLVVKLPPLRERSDLETVVKKILATESNNGRYHVSQELLLLFHRHRWPGNFRQLTNLLRTAIVMAGDEHEICLSHMPDDFLDDMEQAPAQEEMTACGGNLEELEQSAILKSLAAHGGNVSATARALGVSRNTIYRKVPNLK
ncbi:MULTISPECIES: sigma-54-dependent Fis family transcriptional regulator [unclassified Duganella]|uniref:sigma-54-dependent Fis family transcriptional regulator n=1 Tax=unclassified Duganella TaxID=2636909 RepID=UPI000E342E18|nr:MULTISPECIES: sigma-54-dependent Fis family transcriptional regulator [unclassified Duganella]RFP07970.1 sigma-54-dependent Fis family transcriptional regulator [Duganella sp. BJB475]RFP22021.1 sigma-54-dependent Fis family transcriptional regulator [Duganella sp. BJB476]